MKIERISTNFSKIKFFKTREASFNIETIFPKKGYKCVLKKSFGYIIILDGKAETSKGKLIKNNIARIKPGEKFWLKNNSNINLKYLAIDIPSVKEKDIIIQEIK